MRTSHTPRLGSKHLPYRVFRTIFLDIPIDSGQLMERLAKGPGGDGTGREFQDGKKGEIVDLDGLQSFDRVRDVLSISNKRILMRVVRFGR